MERQDLDKNFISKVIHTIDSTSPICAMSVSENAIYIDNGQKTGNSIDVIDKLSHTATEKAFHTVSNPYGMIEIPPYIFVGTCDSLYQYRASDYSLVTHVKA